MKGRLLVPAMEPQRERAVLELVGLAIASRMPVQRQARCQLECSKFKECCRPQLGALDSGSESGSTGGAAVAAVYLTKAHY